MAAVKDILFPEFWASAINEIGIGEFTFQDRVSMQDMEKGGQKGDTVHVPIQGDIIPSQDWDGESELTFAAINATTAIVTLTDGKAQTFKITKKEQKFSAAKLWDIKARPALEGLLNDLNTFIYEKLLAAESFVGTPGGAITTATILAARKKLNQTKAGVNRSFTLSNDHEGEVLDLAAFRNFEQSGDQNVVTEGSLGRKFGFQFMRNDSIAEFTPADVAGLVNGAVSSGATLAVVDAFDDDLGLIRVGDIFVFAGETGSPLHTITKTPLLTGGDTTTIEFFPATVSTVANDSAITISPTQSSIAMTPSAFALGIAPFEPWDEEMAGPVRELIVNYRGVPILVATSIDPKSFQLNVAYSTLYGGLIANQTKVTRMIS